MIRPQSCACFGGTATNGRCIQDHLLRNWQHQHPDLFLLFSGEPVQHDRADSNIDAQADFSGQWLRGDQFADMVSPSWTRSRALDFGNRGCGCRTRRLRCLDRSRVLPLYFCSLAITDQEKKNGRPTQAAIYTAETLKAVSR